MVTSGVNNIESKGYSCLVASTITSNLSSISQASSNENASSIMIVEINGTNSNSFSIYCSINDICKIRCYSSDSCTYMNLYCDGTCYIDCNETNGINCPIVMGNYSYGTGPTLMPTSMPSVFPTELPSPTPIEIFMSTTYSRPSMHPSNHPSTHPSDTTLIFNQTSHSPSNLPSAMPSIQPSGAPAQSGNDNWFGLGNAIVLSIAVITIFCLMIVVVFCIGRVTRSKNNKRNLKAPEIMQNVHRPNEQKPAMENGDDVTDEVKGGESSNEESHESLYENVSNTNKLETPRKGNNDKNVVDELQVELGGNYKYKNGGKNEQRNKRKKKVSSPRSKPASRHDQVSFTF